VVEALLENEKIGAEVKKELLGNVKELKQKREGNAGVGVILEKLGVDKKKEKDVDGDSMDIDKKEEQKKENGRARGGKGGRGRGGKRGKNGNKKRGN